MNRGEIRGIIRKTLGETTSAFWSDVELNQYINLGCSDIAFRTKCLRGVGTLASNSCVANTVGEQSNEYSLTGSFSNIFSITEAYFKMDGDTLIRLEPTSREELDITAPAWQSLVGNTVTVTSGSAAVSTYNSGSVCSIPQEYYWNREENIFGLYPPPNDSNAGADYIKLYYCKNHTDMSSDASVPTIPSPLHLAVVDFSVARGFEDRGWGDRANDFWSKYYLKLRDYRVERQNEREDDMIVSKNYRNIN